VRKEKGEKEGERGTAGGDMHTGEEMLEKEVEGR
jgi:hypothetical protein